MLVKGVPVAYFTKRVNTSFAKEPFNFNDIVREGDFGCMKTFKVAKVIE